MLMDRASPGMIHEPRLDTCAMEATQALEPRHGHADLELFETDGALGVVDAVLLGGCVREDAGAPRHARGRGPVRVRPRRKSRPAAATTRAVGAMLHDAVVDVGLALGLEVRQGARGQLVVAHGTLVLLGDLRRWRR